MNYRNLFLAISLACPMSVWAGGWPSFPLKAAEREAPAEILLVTNQQGWLHFSHCDESVQKCRPLARLSLKDIAQLKNDLAALPLSEVPVPFKSMGQTRAGHSWDRFWLNTFIAVDVLSLASLLETAFGRKPVYVGKEAAYWATILLMTGYLARRVYRNEAHLVTGRRELSRDMALKKLNAVLERSMPGNGESEAIWLPRPLLERLLQSVD